MLTRVAFGRRKDKHENRFLDERVLQLQQQVVKHISS